MCNTVRDCAIAYGMFFDLRSVHNVRKRYASLGGKGRTSTHLDKVVNSGSKFTSIMRERESKKAKFSETIKEKFRTLVKRELVFKSILYSCLRDVWAGQNYDAFELAYFVRSLGKLALYS